MSSDARAPRPWAGGHQLGRSARMQASEQVPAHGCARRPRGQPSPPGQRNTLQLQLQPQLPLPRRLTRARAQLCPTALILPGEDQQVQRRLKRSPHRQGPRGPLKTLHTLNRLPLAHGGLPARSPGPERLRPTDRTLGRAAGSTTGQRDRGREPGAHTLPSVRPGQQRDTARSPAPRSPL